MSILTLTPSGPGVLSKRNEFMASLTTVGVTHWADGWRSEASSDSSGVGCDDRSPGKRVVMRFLTDSVPDVVIEPSDVLVRPIWGALRLVRHLTNLAVWGRVSISLQNLTQHDRLAVRIDRW